MATAQSAPSTVDAITPWAYVNNTYFAQYGANGVVAYTSANTVIPTTGSNGQNLSLIVTQAGQTFDTTTTNTINSLAISNTGTTGTALVNVNTPLTITSGGILANAGMTVSQDLQFQSTNNSAIITPGDMIINWNSANNQGKWMYFRVPLNVGGNLIINGSGTTSGTNVTGGYVVLCRNDSIAGDIYVDGSNLMAQMDPTVSPQPTGQFGSSNGSNHTIYLQGAGSILSMRGDYGNNDYYFNNPVRVVNSATINADRIAAGNNQLYKLGNVTIDNYRTLTISSGNNTALQFGDFTAGKGASINFNSGDNNAAYPGWRQWAIGGLAVNGLLNFTNVDGANVQVNGALSGTGNIYKYDRGQIFLNAAASSYSGSINLFGGAIRANVANAFGSGASITLNNVSYSNAITRQPYVDLGPAVNTSFPASITLTDKYQALGGNLTGAIYSGGSKNVTLPASDVIFPQGTVNTPSRTDRGLAAGIRARIGWASPPWKPPPSTTPAAPTSPSTRSTPSTAAWPSASGPPTPIAATSPPPAAI